jgi:hypothetical protein
VEIQHSNHADGVDWVPRVQLLDAESGELRWQIESRDVILEVANTFYEIIDTIGVGL